MQVCEGLQDTRPGLCDCVRSSGGSVHILHTRIDAQLGIHWDGCSTLCWRLTVMVGTVVAQQRQEFAWRRPSNGERVLDYAGLCEYVRVALPGALIMWLEWWSFEAFALMVGLLPDARRCSQRTAPSLMSSSSVAWHLRAWETRCAPPRASTLARRAAAPCMPCALFPSDLLQGLRPQLIVTLYGLRRPIAEAFAADADVVDAIFSNILGAVLSVQGYSILMTLCGACQVLMPW